MERFLLIRRTSDRMFAIAVEKYRRTSIRQSSVMPTTCMDPSIMRPNIVNVVVANTLNSDHVTETCEFPSGNHRKCPRNHGFAWTGYARPVLHERHRWNPICLQVFKFSEPEEEAVCRRRTAWMVVGHNEAILRCRPHN